MQGYRPQLDSLRAFAVTAVLLAHFWIPQTELSTLGVRLFFVLSGFLLTSILVRERDAAVRNGISRRMVLGDFYARRILRIWPAYYAALIVAMVMGATSVADTFAWHALFASNILFFLEQRWYPQVVAHLWTLSVEEQFYLVLPLIVLFAFRRLLWLLLVGGIVAAEVYRAIVVMTVAGPLDFYFILSIAQLDALGCGALLALVQQRMGETGWKRLLLVSLPVALLLYLPGVPVAVELTLSQLATLLPMAAIVAGAACGIGGRAGRVLSAAPLVALGRISYGIYLYHVFVAAAFDKAADVLGYERLPDGPYRFLLGFSLTIAVAAASWAILERPALSLRRYFRRATPSEALIPAAPTTV